MNFYQLVDKAFKTYTHWLTESRPIFSTIYLSREGKRHKPANKVQGENSMKSRTRQRENCRNNMKQASQTSAMSTVSRPKVIERPWMNHEGYRDPTAHLAIRNIERKSLMHN